MEKRIILLLSLLIGITLFAGCSSPYDYKDKNAEDELRTCSVDNDCVVVSAPGCCGGQYASINKINQDKWTSYLESENKKFNCEVVSCLKPTNIPTESVCANNLCEVKLN